jgi:glutathione S-transferase
MGALTKHLGILEQRLKANEGSGGRQAAFLMGGAAPTAPDYYLNVMLNWTPHIGLDLQVRGWCWVAALLRKCRRESVSSKPECAQLRCPRQSISWRLATGVGPHLPPRPLQSKFPTLAAYKQKMDAEPNVAAAKAAEFPQGR